MSAATVPLAAAAACPGCGRPPAGPPFYEVGGVPTVELRLVTERAAALVCQRGDVRLAFCDGCGLVWNLAFDPALIRYDEDYESTQTASPTFNRFHEALAREVIERYGLRGREVVEIGCGQGEFLGLLCRLGGNRGLGFDPAFLATLGDSAGAIGLVVDINPRKRDTYLPGTGHRVVTPDFLAGSPPDAVVLANPIYRREVGADLAAMGLAPELVPIAPAPGCGGTP